ncbi:MAG: exosortase [Candidatus Omnitrophica bacterium]|nr:exosortase [Candidatus Omnitrophota bacterium]
MEKILKKYWQPILLGALLLVSYFPTFIWMWHRWFTKDTYYSHGWLVPFVTLYLIWQKKDELSQAVKKESKWGFPLIIIGLGLHLVSTILRIYFTSGFSMLIVLVGIILYCFGREVMRIVVFPVAFLAFMIPLPMVMIANISFKMKMFAAEIAAVLLNNMGLQAIRHGSIIKMRNAMVVVDDVCSGLRSLISLTALGSIFAYWMKGPMVKRIVLFLSTVPIAVVTNVCRVIVLSCISEIWGAEKATGFVHDATGYMVFVLAFILLYAVSKILE